MKNNQTDDDYTAELKALDRLVTREFNAFQQKAGKTKRTRTPRQKSERHSENVIFRDHWPNDASARKAKKTPDERIESEVIDSPDEEFEFEHEQEAIDEPQFSSEETMDLFTDEEQDFIQNTADWLGSRANKDLIMSRIWELVTESVPESFYSPQREENQDSEIADPTDDSESDSSTDST